MRSVLLATVFFSGVITASVVLALPTISLSRGTTAQLEENAVLHKRERRGMDGVFDSIANGAANFVKAMKQFGDTLSSTVSGIFSQSNFNHITEGFTKFGKSIQNKVEGVVGKGGSKINKGLKNIGNKIQGAFKEAGGQKDGPPPGQVPDEETT